MAHFKRTATAVWQGTGAEGTGKLNGPSGVLKDTPYSFKARFQNEDGTAGTNPEELIAAGHADNGCHGFFWNINIFINIEHGNNGLVVRFIHVHILYHAHLESLHEYRAGGTQLIHILIFDIKHPGGRQDIDAF